jgi:diacylglycerol kinase family enzyme
MRITLVHNPGAGRNARAGSLIALLRAAGHAVRYQSAKDDSWPDALAWDADVIAVAGGDGTLSRVAKRMPGRGVPLAPLPCGTANNIARSLGIAEAPHEALIRAWPRGRRVGLRVGEARGPWGVRRFVEGVGAGLFASTLPQADANRTLASLERPDAKVAYGLQMLKDRLEHCPAIAIEAELDGESLSGDYLLFEALNIPYIGPNLFLAPDAVPGEGRLVVVRAGEPERDRLREYLSKWQDAKDRLPVLPSKAGNRLNIAWAGFSLHIDDQLEEAPPGARQPVELSMGDETVEFLVPA